MQYGPIVPTITTQVARGRYVPVSAFREQLEPLSFGLVAWRNYLKVPAVERR